MPTASGHTRAIRASRVIGTPLYGDSLQVVGKVEDVILDKTGERILFAVVSVGGALIAGDNFYPVPWSVLDYDEGTGGYVLAFGKDRFVDAPSAAKMSDLTDADAGSMREAALAHFGERGGS